MNILWVRNLCSEKRRETGTNKWKTQPLQCGQSRNTKNVFKNIEYVTLHCYMARLPAAVTGRRAPIIAPSCARSLSSPDPDRGVKAASLRFPPCGPWPNLSISPAVVVRRCLEFSGTLCVCFSQKHNHPSLSVGHQDVKNNSTAIVSINHGERMWWVCCRAAEPFCLVAKHWTK